MGLGMKVKQGYLQIMTVKTTHTMKRNIMHKRQIPSLPNLKVNEVNQHFLCSLGLHLGASYLPFSIQKPINETS